MKYLIYAALVGILPPLQVVLLEHASILGVRPDLALIAVCLIGLHEGELDAIMVGLVLGFTQDLFSGGLHWDNLWLKPVIGLLAGLASRSLVNISFAFALALLLALSIFSGTVMYLLKSLPAGGGDFLAAARGIILPQACYDALLGTLLLKLVQHWSPLRVPRMAAGYD